MSWNFGKQILGIMCIAILQVVCFWATLYSIDKFIGLEVYLHYIYCKEQLRSRSIDRLRVIDINHTSLPVQSIRCVLAGIHPPPDDSPLYDELLAQLRLLFDERKLIAVVRVCLLSYCIYFSHYDLLQHDACDAYSVFYRFI